MSPLDASRSEGRGVKTGKQPPGRADKGATRDKSASTQEIPFHRPHASLAEERAVLRVLRSGWLTMGPETVAFEKGFAAYVDARNAAAVSSATAGIHLALLAAGIGPGDEVITSVNTFCATLEAIEYVGAQPVLADVEDDTLNISPEQVRRRITARTAAILPIDFAGHPCEMDELKELAEQHQVPLILDAAHSLSAHYRDMPVGSQCDATIFSFYVTKPLSTGEGGMVTTARADWDEKIRVLRLHGMNRDAWKRYDGPSSWYYEVEQLGYKYNMTDLQAAIGRVQLERQESLRAKRERIADIYREELSGIEEITLPTARDHVRHAWHLFVIRLLGGGEESLRGRVVEALASQRIGTSVHFIPIHYHPHFARVCGCSNGDFPVMERMFEQVLSLPIFPDMKVSDVRRVARAVKAVVGAQDRLASSPSSASSS